MLSKNGRAGRNGNARAGKIPVGISGIDADVGRFGWAASVCVGVDRVSEENIIVGDSSEREKIGAYMGARYKKHR